LLDQISAGLAVSAHPLELSGEAKRLRLGCPVRNGTAQSQALSVELGSALEVTTVKGTHGYTEQNDRRAALVSQAAVRCEARLVGSLGTFVVACGIRRATESAQSLRAQGERCVWSLP
jgi:hypothetical protein